MPKLISRKDVKERLGISEAMLQRLICSGQLRPPSKITKSFALIDVVRFENTIEEEILKNGYMERTEKEMASEPRYRERTNLVLR
ncbi:MAG: hypothetical protein WCI55_11795 [Armatimonadota bacterium]